MLVAVAWLYPHAFANANRAARANARLDNIDRALGGGNSVLPAQAMRILSWAAKSCGEEKQTAMIVKYSQNRRRIKLAPSNRNEFRGMAMGKI